MNRIPAPKVHRTRLNLLLSEQLMAANGVENLTECVAKHAFQALKVSIWGAVRRHLEIEIEPISAAKDVHVIAWKEGKGDKK